MAADFDRIARLPADRWDHNSRYYPFLISHIPARGAAALDIGCGRGSFARLLAERFDHVDAIDLSPTMVRVAKSASEGFPNIRFRIADALAWPFVVSAYDCVASIATMHHLDLEDMLTRIRDTLRPGGVLAILDLYEPESLADRLAELVAIPAAPVLRVIKTGRLRAPCDVRAAWAAHGEHDRYLALVEVRRICGRVIPGAQVTRHLLWRYSIIWVKRPSER